MIRKKNARKNSGVVRNTTRMKWPSPRLTRLPNSGERSGNSTSASNAVSSRAARPSTRVCQTPGPICSDHSVPSHTHSSATPPPFFSGAGTRSSVTKRTSVCRLPVHTGGAQISAASR